MHVFTRCDRCGMDTQCTSYEDVWLCTACIKEVDAEEFTLSNLESEGAVTSKSLSTSFPAPSALSPRLHALIQDVESQAENSIKALKALKEEKQWQ